MKYRLLFCLLLLFPAISHGAPVAILNEAGVQIMLYDEPCDIKAPKNLIYRATWTKGAEKSDGCFSVFLSGIVGLYFDDDTVAIAPLSMFKPVQEI